MPAMLLRLTGVLAFVAFLVLGIVWSSAASPSDALVTFWIVSFVLATLIALLSEFGKGRSATLGELWESVPGPSKNPDDYR